MGKRVLRTALCDMLGIEYPILSAGMGPTLIGEKTGAKERDPFLDTDLDGLLRTHGGGIEFHHDVRVRQIKIFLDLVEPILVRLGQALDDLVERNLLCSLRLQGAAPVHARGQEEIHPVRLIGLRLDLPDGIAELI